MPLIILKRKNRLEKVRGICTEFTKVLRRIFNFSGQNSDNHGHHYTCPVCGGCWLVEVVTCLMMGLCCRFILSDVCRQWKWCLPLWQPSTCSIWFIYSSVPMQNCVQCLTLVSFQYKYLTCCDAVQCAWKMTISTAVIRLLFLITVW